MKLATLRMPTDADPQRTIAVRVDDGHAIEIQGFADVGALLAHPDWRDIAEGVGGVRLALADVPDAAWAPVVPRPSKIVCVGLNYRAHILEMGRALPEHPTLFAKYPEALIGAYDDIVLPPHAAEAADWEAELAIILGATARRLDEASAADAIAGYSVINDVTMRDYQNRTLQWLQGKTFEKTAPLGPVLVTADVDVVGATLSAHVNGERVQGAPTDDLVFGPAALVSYISQIVTLHPGDIIASGTPGGVGHARTPQRYLAAGDELVTAVEGIGELRNRVVLGL